MLRKNFFCAFCAKSFCKMRNGSHGLTIHVFFFSSPSSRKNQELSHLLKWTGFSENKELREREIFEENDNFVLWWCERVSYRDFHEGFPSCMGWIIGKDWRGWRCILNKRGWRDIELYMPWNCFLDVEIYSIICTKIRNRKGILSYNIEDKFKIRNSKSLWV